MKVEIINFEESEPAMLQVCLERVRRWFGPMIKDSAPCEIHCNAREPSGWLQYVLKLTYPEGGQIWVAAIQRTVGAEVEFHS